MRSLSRLVREYEWIHLCLGVTGNTFFVVGSVFFFWETLKTAAVCLFVAGSALMLLGALGNALTKIYQVEKGEKKAPPMLHRPA